MRPLPPLRFHGIAQSFKLSAPEIDSSSRPLFELCKPGQLVELCGGVGRANFSTAVSLLAQAQREGESCVWIQSASGPLFPPDLAQSGIDLNALIILRIPDEAGRHALCRSAELLLRSGGFGLLVIDLAGGLPPGSPSAWQGRILGLARKHESRVLLLRDSSAQQESLGPLIGLRVESRLKGAPPEPTSPGTRLFQLEHHILKNKSGGPLYPKPDLYRGPSGL